MGCSEQSPCPKDRWVIGGFEMLVAEIHGKISPNYPPHQRMEDVLTSNVLSMFRYLNDIRLPIAFLCQAKNLKDQKLVLPDLNVAQVIFWPKFSFYSLGYREPDCLLLFDGTDCCRTAVIIEAKYDSGLTNIDNGNEEESNVVKEDSFIYGHQLADQYCGMFCGRWNLYGDINNKLTQAGRRVLIYLTAHYEFPQTDILDALKSIKKRVCKEKKAACWENAESNIYWISWRNLYTLIGQYISQYTGGERNYLRDLQDLLEVRNLLPFRDPFKELKDVDVYERLLGEKVSPSTQLEKLNNLVTVKPYQPIFKY